MGSESLARAMQGGLTYDSAAWDKLTAMALGSVRSEHRTARESLLNALGVSLLGFKHAMRPDLFTRAATDLRDCMGWKVKLSRNQRQEIAQAAIREWVVDVCPTCCGSGHIFDSYGVERLCNTCGGSRKRRYSDEEREQTVSGAAKVVRAYDAAHSMIAFAIGTAIRQAQERLK